MITGLGYGAQPHVQPIPRSVPADVAQGVTSAPALTTPTAFAHLLRFGAFAHTSHSTRGNATEQAEPRPRAL